MIESEIKILEDKLSEILECKSDIYSDINKFVLTSSKRIRSKLAILYIKANDKQIDENIYNVLVAGELIHNASLLHDDIIDGNNIRRGELTIGEKYSPELSILSGDYLLSLAVKSLLKTNNSDILNKFLECTQTMSQTEIIQFLNRGRKPNEVEYKNICRGKTAKLFETILESCAVLSGLKENEAQKLGEKFGILFQIINDNSEDSRKCDAKNGIYTAYDIFGIEKTNALIDNYKEEIVSFIGDYPNESYRAFVEDLVNSL